MPESSVVLPPGWPKRARAAILTTISPTPRPKSEAIEGFGGDAILIA